MRPSLLVPLLLTLSACASDTEGERVSFQLMATASGDDAPFATASGWTIDIQQAEVILGPVFLFDAEPIARAPWSSWLVSEAHAHVPTQAGAVLEGFRLQDPAPEWSVAGRRAEAYRRGL